MPPLLVAWVPYDVKGVELGHRHFYRMASMQNVGGVKYQWWILTQKKKTNELRFLFSFLFSNYHTYYCSESKPIVYPNTVCCNFRSD